MKSGATSFVWENAISLVVVAILTVPAIADGFDSLQVPEFIRRWPQNYDYLYTWVRGLQAPCQSSWKKLLVESDLAFIEFVNEPWGRRIELSSGRGSDVWPDQMSSENEHDLSISLD